jgi:GNAT superfamily N-acetyltransferase
MMQDDVQTRRATPSDAEAIAAAHLDSIRSIGPAFYPPETVETWASGITPQMYVRAMDEGEAFFIATGRLHDQLVVLGFASHRVDDAQHGVSVYVRGGASRHGLGTALFRLAESHALEHGATSIQIDATLAGVEFYKANGFEEVGPSSIQPVPCVVMRKRLTSRTH